MKRTTKMLLEREKYFGGDQLYFGMFRGIVEYNQDPLMLGRVKARVPALHGTLEQFPTEHLPWCNVLQLGGGMPQKGSFIPLDVGSGVLVGFEGGDTRYPFCMGSYISMPIEQAVSEADAEAMTMIDDVPSVRVHGKSDVAVQWDETKSFFNRMVSEHFPTAMQVAFQERELGETISEGRVGTDETNLSMMEGAFAGARVKANAIRIEVSDDNADELKILLFGTKIGSITVDKATGALTLNFEKVTVASNLEVLGDAKVLGRVLGG